MTDRPKRRGLLLPGLLVALGVLVLLGLGTWQVYRLRWKEGILAEIAAAEKQPPAPLTGHPPDYGRVAVTGHFLFDKALWLGVDVRDTARGSVMGHFQLVPLARDHAPTILVNRGWVPEHVQPADPAGTVSVTGYVHPGEQASWFSPADDFGHHEVYVLDPPKIAGALGIGPVLPFSLTALGTVPDGVYPVPAADFPRPPNNHLSYAITWYSLALVLVVMAVVRFRSKQA
ncbi:MAG TPA: SURF1 family protein [Rhodopila sp.]|uniref:SURF1 family protein n=1 Tax=Rhodopila sp. TaxID=2480087 RepID=UPI002B7DC169|nr:SURF1 family protein [Rhodopila sp.]HVY13785.1 SURF1 family protein [Rhodopila sp.]